MTATPTSPTTPRTLKDIGIAEEAHPIWMQSFSSDLRSEQLHDDHSAWYAVTGLLLFIIAVGVSLAIFTVAVCLS